MMESWKRRWRWIRMHARRGARERRMDEEMRFHIDMEAASLHRDGLSAEEARRRAHCTFGSIERYKEEAREARPLRPLSDLGPDLRYAVRQLRASPGFAAATVSTLALGICAVTLMQGSRRSEAELATGVTDPERLVYVGQGPVGCPRCAGIASGNGWAILDQARSFEHGALFTEWEPTLRGTERAELLDGLQVTTGIFSTLGIRPLLGRLFVPSDGEPGSDPVVVLGESAWRARLGSDPAVIGRTVVLDRQPYTVIGVVPEDVIFPNAADPTEVWAPLIPSRSLADDRTGADFTVIGRLHDGATPGTAGTELGGIAGRLASEYPDVMEGTTFLVTPLLALARVEGDAATRTFTAAVGLVLLTACINLAGLLIARLSSRRRELAVRRALGARPARIVRQLMAETVLLTGLGGLCGLAVAALAGRAVTGRPGFHLDARAFVVALALGLMSGVVIGLWPALRSVRRTASHESGELARRGTPDVDTARGRRALVIAQVALAIVLLSAAGLLTRSYQQILAIDPGFRTDGLLALRVQSPPPAPGTTIRSDQFDRLVAAIEAVPGVERAGAVLGMPFGVGSFAQSFEIEGLPPVDPERLPRARMQAASPGYFRAVGMLVSGRAFAHADRAGALPVAIVNRTLARQHFGDQDPIGRSVVIDGVRCLIVGVAADVFHGDAEFPTHPEIYRPLRQWPRSSVWIAARIRDTADGAAPAVRAAIRAFDLDIAITRFFTMEALRADSMASERTMLRLMGAFSLAALLISAIGLYGLISYSVAQRTREFGVRLALGARGGSVVGLVMRQGLRLVAAGAALGIAGALAALRVMRSMLYGVSPTDPFTLGGVVLLICAVAVLACYLPARRATLVDPLRVLRQE